MGVKYQQKECLKYLKQIILGNDKLLNSYKTTLTVIDFLRKPDLKN